MEKYFIELLKVGDRGKLHDIISKFASEPQVSMHSLSASYIHKSSCNTVSCSLLVSCKNYRPLLTSLQNSLKYKTIMHLK